MKKKIWAVLLAGTLSASLFAGCGSSGDTAADGASDTSETADASGDGQLDVVLSLADESDYYIGTMVGATVKTAFEEEGANVQVLDGANDVQNQVNQIQNAITQGADIIYVFTAGNGDVYVDVLNQAKEAGIKTILSGNDPGEGVVDAYIGADEFQFGVMMAKMCGDWVNETYPDAADGEVGILFAEASGNSNMIKRCIGMRSIEQKFLREADMANIGYVVEEGEGSVTYLDENGNEQEVDEPTGGLLLDENGYAQLNPYYNSKVRVITYGDRNAAGLDSTIAQNAIEDTITNGETNLCGVLSYGDTGAAIETKMREMIDDGRIDKTYDQVACWCSDLTDTNRDLIMKSVTGESVLRGVGTSGDAIASVCDVAKKMCEGSSDFEAHFMEPISYVIANEDGSDVIETDYSECTQLPDTSLIIPE